MAFDLRDRSHQFKDELSDFLNATVCQGVRLNCMVFKTAGYTVVGYKNDRHNPRGAAFPLKINRDPKFYLSLSIRLHPDPRGGDFLMVHSSAMILRTGPEITDGNMLLHYDYERDKPDDYPEAHLQICATSEEWEKTGVRLDGNQRLLPKLHLPVGGRRFRPTLEDIVEFLIVEKLVESREGWKQAVKAGRDRFREKQLRAAIRNTPEVALDQLRKDGHID
ncbi:hypothetical protein [Mycolicibacterium mageritense]|uniref:Uncharacterized protein n=1 Tax=Mycolicibacterium mageritense TaxID=53462 RepID=A0AAI8U2U4_MYCME|nr:hypothetical protein [Mycolicibacterium mageritense]BDY32991.1 hypothetical protein hbim_06963 [Mycolicibacterium mageritense]